METLWDALDDKEKIHLFTSLLKYVIPPATTLEDDKDSGGEESTVNDTIRQLNEFHKLG
jgi:hypothetical protein